ncbi:MAG: chalcone isomerase family protein [Desulfobacteraceae bacterium]|jgi:hypothetical protein
MLKRFLVVLVALLLSSTCVSALEVGGVVLPDTMKGGDANLLLNGAGIRRKFGLKVYVVGLYLKAKNSNSAAVLNGDEPMALQCKFRMSIPPRKIDEVFYDSFGESMKIPKKGSFTAQSTYGSITKEVVTFMGYIDKRDVAKSDTWIFTYIPGKGTEIKINNGTKDELFGVIKGQEFKKALFGIWIADHAPVGSSLRDELLGK